MSWLPRYLAPWQSELEDLTDPIWRTMEALADAVAPLVAAEGPAIDSDDAELDGYDGVTSRGPLDRLQLSEWMMMRVAPMEFLRRATQNELSYLRPRRVSPQARRGILVLLDAGPDQLGGPRIAQMALLLALQARAQAQDAAMFWSAIHNTSAHGSADGALAVHEGLSPAATHAFLKLRTVRRPTAAQVRTWEAAVRDRTLIVEADRPPAVAAPTAEANAEASAQEPAPGAPEPRTLDHDTLEVWWLGGAPLMRLVSPEARTVSIAPDLAWDIQQALDSTTDRSENRLEHRLNLISTFSRTQERRNLVLPKDADCVRLLRQPFRQARPQQGDDLTAIPGALVFSGAHRLFVRRSEDEVIGVHVPNSPRAKHGKLRHARCELGGRVFAVGMSSRKRCMLIERHGATYFVAAGTSVPVMFDGNTSPPDFSCHLVHLQHTPRGHYFILDGPNLWRSNTAQSNPKAYNFVKVPDAIEDHNGQTQTTLLFRDRKTTVLVRNGQGVTEEFPAGPTTRRLVLATHQHRAYLEIGEDEVRQRGATGHVWKLDGAEFVGCGGNKNDTTVYALRGARTLVAITALTTRTVATFPWPIETHTFASRPLRFAGMNADGDFAVFAIDRDAFVLHPGDRTRAPEGMP